MLAIEKAVFMSIVLMTSRALIIASGGDRMVIGVETAPPILRSNAVVMGPQDL